MSDDRQAGFLALVDQFTPLHLEILNFCRNPQLPKPSASSRTIPDYERPTLHKVLFERFTSLRAEVGSKIDGREAASVQFVTLVVRELVTAQLLTKDFGRDKGIFNKVPTYPCWVTHLGEDFLDFIAPPIEEEK